MLVYIHAVYTCLCSTCSISLHHSPQLKQKGLSLSLLDCDFLYFSSTILFPSCNSKPDHSSIKQQHPPAETDSPRKRNHISSTKIWMSCSCSATRSFFSGPLPPPTPAVNTSAPSRDHQAEASSTSFTEQAIVSPSKSHVGTVYPDLMRQQKHLDEAHDPLQQASLEASESCTTNDD